MTDKKRIYLDYNATTPLYPTVIEGMASALQHTGNPSSIHYEGRQSRKMIEQARAQIAKCVGCQPKQVIFTSGATEANNMILKGYAPHRRILVSAIEHPSVLHSGVDVEVIPVLPTGLIDLDALKRLLESDSRPTLVSIMMVNNETGTIQPIEDIVALLKNYDCLFHSDSVQALGRIPLDFSTMGANFITLSAHKIGGPQGIGALIMAQGLNPPKLIHGGGQERLQRAGTENVIAIHGFGIAASKIAAEDIPSFQEKLKNYRHQIEKALKASYPSIIINACDSPRVGNTLSISIDGLDTSMLLINLDLEGISVSAGSACSSGSVHTSHVLKAMGHTDSLAKNSLRISMGWDTTQQDIDAFIEAWGNIIGRQ